ncbi:Bifunctional purine biosynthetic protein ADE1 [Teratosphaeriaceae sp. CCFEE 6253]|nr:Bifunctional purine biosynthetic protein ADE1 [Teratosphaeriaceae sp. CCFEE 6253]
MMSAKLRILLVGNGGRENALAWKLAQSDRVECIHVVPGNGGTAGVHKTTNIPSISQEDFPALLAHARAHTLNFLIPGPEAPLVAGITDYFHSHAPGPDGGIRVFGPSAAAARMEGSKTFAKDFMSRHRIPTAAYAKFTELPAAQQYLDALPPGSGAEGIVIKADGLAGGKGVVLPSSLAEAHAALQSIMADHSLGPAGHSVVIEERLEGDELSILSLTDGHHILSLPPAQDHKRIGDSDTGPNTGGMGTYAPTPLVTPAQLEEIETTILRPTIDGLRGDGMPFVGCLFTGIMLTRAGPRVLEYNVRFGDPETQSLLALLDSDLGALMAACCAGSLAEQAMEVKGGAACTVVLAAGGYPGSYAKGTPIAIRAPQEGEGEDGVEVFHAGTTLDEDGRLRTSGGRVMAVTATGATLREAVDKAYEGVGRVAFEGMQFRRDIAGRALK